MCIFSQIVDFIYTMTKSEQLRKIAEYYGFNDAQFANHLGIKPQTLSNWHARNTYDAERIYTKCVEISGDWLLGAGEGQMLRSIVEVADGELQYIGDKSLDLKKIEKQIIPVYDLEASAGLVSLFKNPSNFAPVDYLMIPNLGKVDGGIFAFGDSMYPLIKSGDIPIYRQLNDIKYSTIWGETYILSFDLEGEEYIVIKYVQKSELAGHIKLVSQNQHHQPMDISIERINAFAQVKASVRYMTIRVGL